MKSTIIHKTMEHVAIFISLGKSYIPVGNKRIKNEDCVAEKVLGLMGERGYRLRKFPFWDWDWTVQEICLIALRECEIN